MLGLLLILTIGASEHLEAWKEAVAPHISTELTDVKVGPSEVLLEVADLDSLDETSHDHLLASFYGTLGIEYLEKRYVRVVDRRGRTYVHRPMDIKALLANEHSGDGAYHPSVERQRYRDGLLAGRHFALSAGHGIMWDDDRWRYQRSELFELREDLHTNHIMAGMIAPMLERMGAVLTMVRGAGFTTQRWELDDSADGYQERGVWQDGSSAGGRSGGYRVAQVSEDSISEASWNWTPDTSGEYPVYVWFVEGSNRSQSASYKISSGTHVETVRVNQTIRGSRWVYLGTFPFAAGIAASVTLSNEGDDPSTYVIADSIWVGGGIGRVDFGGGPSGQRFWEQSAQAQSREFSLPSEVSEPYGDVTVRPAWAIWEDVDLYLSLHTNAGGGRGTSSFVYSNQVAYPSFDPNRAESVPPGTLEFQDAIHDRMIESVQRFWNPDWRDRGKWGANFGELRPLTLAWREQPSLEIPAMLIELAFHDSEDDTYYLREERFRMDMSRAIVRGIIDYVYRDSDAIPPLPPLAPADIAIDGQGADRRLRWRSSMDPIDPSSEASSYRIEVSDDGVVFFPFATTTTTQMMLTETEECVPRVWRVVALNESGESLPSEQVIDLKVAPFAPRILWVDGHRRWVQTVNESPVRPQPAHRMLTGIEPLIRAGIGMDSTRAEVVGAGDIQLEQYDMVIWSTGETSTVDQSLNGSERAAIESYLESGGFLLLSGSEIAWHLGRSFDEEERRFFEEVLGASYVADASSSYQIAWMGVDGEADVEMVLDSGEGDYQRVGYPDVIDSDVRLGVTVAEYGADGEGAAIFGPALNGMLLYLGFPIEALKDAAWRSLILEESVTTFLGTSTEEPNGCAPQASDPVLINMPLEPVDLVPETAPSGGETLAEQDESTDSCLGCSGADASTWWLLGLLYWAQRRLMRPMRESTDCKTQSFC